MFLDVDMGLRVLTLEGVLTPADPASLWHKAELTLDEVNQLCLVSQTPYEKYREDAKKSAGVV